jgi:hypothetical protein
VPLQDEVEPDLEDLVLGRARVGVGERVPRGRELVEEAARDRDVNPPKVRGERLDPDRLRAGARGSRRREARRSLQAARLVLE